MPDDLHERDQFGDPCPHGIFHDAGDDTLRTVCKACHEDIVNWHEGTFVHPCDVGHQIGEAVEAERARNVAIIHEYADDVFAFNPNMRDGLIARIALEGEPQSTKGKP